MFRYIFLSFILFNSSYCNNQKKETGILQAKDLLPYGRSQMTSGQGLELISSGVHFGFSFEGNFCTVYTSIPAWLDHNYLQYEMDGIYQKRIKIFRNADGAINIKAPTNGKHIVWIYKATEATTGPVFIQKIEGRNLHPIPNSSAPLIEFIGNSITCGAQADASEIPCGVGEYHDYTNAYMAYGPRVARALKINFLLSSVSGIGIYRTWNTEEPSMPQVYEKTDFQVSNTRSWDFSLYTPKIVSIALGTNDLSDGDGINPRTPFDSSRFVNTYISFVKLIHSKYPDAQIALLGSPMINGNKKTELENCLTVVKAAIDTLHLLKKPIALYFFKPMQARGCSGHPSVEDHAVLAEELVPFFRELLNK